MVIESNSCNESGGEEGSEGRDEEGRAAKMVYKKPVSGKRAASRFNDKVPRGTPGKSRTLGQCRPRTRVEVKR